MIVQIINLRFGARKAFFWNKIEILRNVALYACTFGEKRLLDGALTVLFSCIIQSAKGTVLTSFNRLVEVLIDRARLACLTSENWFFYRTSNTLLLKRIINKICITIFAGFKTKIKVLRQVAAYARSIGFIGSICGALT